LDAVVMAGGQGNRMNLPVEKPLIEINGKKLIEFVINALEDSIEVENIFLSVTPNVTETQRWLEGSGYNVNIINTSGSGFVPDMIDCVIKADIKESVLVTTADLAFVTGEMIDEIINKYYIIPQPALSVYNPLSIYLHYNLHPSIVFKKKGKSIVPLGINILNVEKIHDEQEDYNYILEDHRFVMNVNTIEDLKVCNKIMKCIEKSSITTTIIY
jgi:adenosylcobinamide-phosphate guanylyltransferase